MQLKIISLDDASKSLPRNQEGEILIKSGQMLNCYLNNVAATDEAIDSDGWFHTGDVGKIDDNGNVSITDRLKEVIKVKG